MKEEARIAKEAEEERQRQLELEAQRKQAEEKVAVRIVVFSQNRIISLM